MDITIRRNTFGRQVDSFETDLAVPALGPAPLRAVFIRAPEVLAVGAGVEVLARYEGHIVLVRQGRFLGAAFHPELTGGYEGARVFLERVLRGVIAQSGAESSAPLVFGSPIHMT